MPIVQGSWRPDWGDRERKKVKGRFLLPRSHTREGLSAAWISIDTQLVDRRHYFRRHLAQPYQDTVTAPARSADRQIGTP
jgi:hypothetical protein